MTRVYVIVPATIWRPRRRRDRLASHGRDEDPGRGGQALRGAGPRGRDAGLGEGGVGLVLVETVPSLDPARAAVTAVKTVSELPVVVSLTFNEEGTTFYGDKPEDVVRAVEEWDVAVVGANCSQGPQPMLETVRRMAAAATRVKLSAMPNAGAPALVDGRYVYLCTPEYMASYARRFIAAGVSMVGGCCGTTPAHIRNLVRSVRMVQPAREVVALEAPVRAKEAPAPVPREDKSPL